MDLPADQVFRYLAEPGHLREFLPEVIRPEGVRVDKAQRRLLWTADGGQRGGGEVAVSDAERGTCTVRIELHGDRSDEEVSPAELERSVAILAQRVLAEDKVEDAGRAWH